MKYFIIIFLSFNYFVSDNLLANINSNIVLKVENEIITNYDVKNKIISSLILSNKDINQENINKSKKQALDSLIQFKLKKIELEKYNLTYDKANITNYLMAISQNDIVGLKNKFKAYDLDYQSFLDQVKVQFKWQKLIYQIYSRKIEIDEKSLAEELDDLIENKNNLEEYKLSQIEILINNDDTDAEKIEDLKKAIKDEGFENAAMKYSDSYSTDNKSNIGWVNAKSMSKPIFDIVKNMKQGDVSKAIKRQNSIIFLKLEKKRNNIVSDKNIDEMRKNLINQKKNELFNLYSNSHLSKLRNTSFIEYK